jgi:hypothetical protein
MSSNPFLPQGNSVALTTSTTSNSIQVNYTGTTVCLTNNSRGNAWVTWNLSSPPTALFPTPGDTVGQFGVAIPPGVQVTLGTQNQAGYVSAILDSGVGTLWISPGDGL